MLRMLTEGALLQSLGGFTLDKGRRVRLLGSVRTVEVSRDGSRVSARVASSRQAGRSGAFYSQTISLDSRANRLHIKGYCTCPVGLNCKHVAAALLELMAGGRGEKASARHAIGDAEDPSPRGPRPPDLRAPDRSLVDVANFDQASALAAIAHADWSADRASRPTTPPPVTADVRAWLARMDAARHTAPIEASASVGHGRTLFYVLDIAADRGRGPASVATTAAAGITVAVVRPTSVRHAGDGSPPDRAPVHPVVATKPSDQRPGYLDADDVAILTDLALLSRSTSSANAADICLPPTWLGRTLLSAMLATGRARWASTDGPVLTAASPVAGDAVWQPRDNGRQQLTFVAAPGAAPASQFSVVLPLWPPHYVDVSTGHVGLIATDLPSALALEVARAPIVTATEAGHVADALTGGPAAANPAKPSNLTRGTQARSPAAPAAAPPSASAPALPLPHVAIAVETRLGTPTPCLDLRVVQARVRPHYLYLANDPALFAEFALPVARLSFDYTGTRVSGLAAAPQTVEHLEGDTLVVFRRDRTAEHAALRRLASMGFEPLAQLAYLDAANARSDDFVLRPHTTTRDSGGASEVLGLLAPARFVAFSAKALPQLEADGWRIAVAPDYPYRIAAGPATWWADTGESKAAIDWFSFELGISFEGHRINLVPQLAAVVARLPEALLAEAHEPGGPEALQAALRRVELYHPLPDGRLLPIPGERLAPALTGLIDLIGPRAAALTTGRIDLHRTEATSLTAFADTFGGDAAWSPGAAQMLALGRSLAPDANRPPALPPVAFKATLRPYQQDGLNWLEMLRESQFGGVLADDMGLGKTVQALAFIAREKAAGRLDRPALLVAPTSVLPNWIAEARRFAPDLRVVSLRGADRHEQFAHIANHDLVLTTYPLLARDQERLLSQKFHIAILDEAQAIKNPKAAVSEVAHRIDASHRVALTGTPLENNLGEVWSLFQFLCPGLLGDAATFRRLFRTPIEKHGDAQAQAFLSRRLRPFMLRRTKAEVAKELPPKTVMTERIRLEGPQRDLYETVRALMHEKVREEIARKGLAKSHIVFLDALLKLRQVCCDPRLMKLPAARRVKGSAKLARLMEMIPELVSEGRRILLFSQFTSMLSLIEAELERCQIPFVKLTGDTEDRAEPVRLFQEGDVPVFLLSLKAGGTGLNLTAADTVIHYDPWWNPAVENQATDRAYRIGQMKPVFVYKMIVEEGIEEAIEQLKQRKSALAEALFAETGRAATNLTEADVAALFAPLGAASTERPASRRPRTARALSPAPASGSQGGTAKAGGGGQPLADQLHRDQALGERARRRALAAVQQATRNKI